MSKTNTTDRRSFLKSGAIVAAPVAAIAAPAAAFAGDDSKAKLARLKDERAIAGLQRALLRDAQGGRLTKRLKLSGSATIQPDFAADSALEIAAGGEEAVARHPCTLEIAAPIDGPSSIEEMARLQGSGTAARRESRVLEARYRKRSDGWAIDGLRLA